MAIDTRGISGRHLIDALGERVVAWDDSGDPPTAHTVPVRPPEIDDADNLRRLPVALSLAMGVAMMLGLSVIVLLSVRDADADSHHAGCSASPGRRSASVRWQAVTTIVLALLVGIPLGWIAGRTPGWSSRTRAGRPADRLSSRRLDRRRRRSDGPRRMPSRRSGLFRAATRPMKIRELNG